MQNVLNSPERSKRRRKGNGLKSRFGITIDQYNAMEVEQNYTCIICNGKDKSGRSLAVDHCHTTGKVRGLLCTECNTALGLFKDETALLNKAIEYLNREYTLPAAADTIGCVHRDDAKGWKMLVVTPASKFPSMQHASEYYSVHTTTIRSWCMAESKYKRDGFSCTKMFASLNEMKDLINNEEI